MDGSGEGGRWRREQSAQLARFIHTTGIVSGLFAFMFWAGSLVAVLTGGFRPLFLVTVVLWTIAAWLGFLGWRRWNASLSWASVAVMAVTVLTIKWLAV